MIKSQHRKPKLFIIFVFVFITSSFSVYCESTKEKLSVADSLFSERRYTQSFELYDEIQKIDKKSSPAMLLKMAFIKEGLGDYTNALFYLNLYYLTTFNKRVLKKMENLADKNKLSGYNYDDVEFFLNIYQKYQLQADLLVVSFVLLSFGLMLFGKRTRKINPTSAGFVYIGLLLLLFVINNFARERTKAIIISSEVYLMDGPSPGADVVEVISEGHRVDIIERDDVWVKISWNDDYAYIKTFDLKPIEL